MNDRAPIAIVGMACRFPGSANTPDRFWRNLLDGVDGIVEVPKTRWDLRKFHDPENRRPGKAHADRGGFLNENVFLFDPLFFGISPREAGIMDPQQRYLLEVTWEALEDAGIQPSGLKGGRVGVFVGGFCLDNMLIQLDRANRENLDSNSAVATTMTLLANRISYIYDFRGPSMTVDTACSSSLVAAHLACQSLRSGESELAVVGGVNLMLKPEFPLVMSKGRFLSKHGYCRMFDEDASGYTRGEGAGVVILKPYDCALADGDSIYAVILESGSNQDGHTQGIAFPNIESQEALLRDVYRRAGVAPREITYVEAHGTGTQAGDRAEAGALDAVLSEGRPPGETLLVGSVKTAIGHLEAAAGVAGLIKTALCLDRGKIPPNLHFDTPNPAIPFDRMCLEVPREVVDWRANRERYAAINSFGYGGSNAHLLLRSAAPAPDTRAAPGETEERAARPFIFPISTRDDQALRELAGRYATWLEDAGGTVALEDLLHSACFRRDHLSHRLGIVAGNLDELKEKLRAFRRGEPDPDVVSGTLRQPPARGPVFVFTGMGPQWSGMGAELYASEPVFRAAVDRCGRVFEELTGWRVVDELFSASGESRMQDTLVAQTANFVIQVALVELLEEMGVTPAAVVGHSVGEVAAAYVAGVLSLEDAVWVSYHRGRLQKSTAGGAGMLALGISEDEARDLLKNDHDVEIAAVNAPRSVTLSGDPGELAWIGAWAEGKGIFHRALDVEVAYHSRRMDAIRDPLHEALARLRPGPAKLPFYSTVTGGPHSGETLIADYWWYNVREPVRFDAAIRAMIADGHTQFVEVGPHPVLRSSLSEMFADTRATAVSLPTLNRRTPERRTFYRSLAGFHLAGIPLEWNALQPRPGRYVKLPHYPWRKEVHWQESRWTRQDRLGSGGPVCLFEEVYSPQPSWRVDLTPRFFPWLVDHRVQGEPVFPAAAFIEIGLYLHQRLYDESAFVVENLRFHNVLSDDPTGAQTLHTNWDPRTREYSVFSSRSGNENHWRHHCVGRLLDRCAPAPGPALDVGSFIGVAPVHLAGSAHYADMERRGLSYGPTFRGIQDVWIDGRKILVEVLRPDGLEPDGSPFHPALLDAAFQSLILMVKQPGTFVPVAIDRLTCHGAPGDRFYCLGELLIEEDGYVVGRIDLHDENGVSIGRIEGLRCRALGSVTHDPGESAQRYGFRWTEFDARSHPAPVRRETVLVLSERADSQGAVVAGELSGSSVPVRAAALDGDDLSEVLRQAIDSGTTGFVVCVPAWYHADWTGDGKSVALGISRYAARVAGIVRVLAGREETVRLTFVGTGGQAVVAGETADNPLMGALWELGQVIANEHPRIRCRMIDVAPGGPARARVADAILRDDPVTDLACREDGLYTRRLVRLGAEREESAVSVDCARVPVVLEPGAPGDLDGMRYRRTSPGELGEHEVEVNVRATSLNFKDVLKAYGQLDPVVTEGTYYGNAIGMEVSGVVTRVGSAVTGFAAGDPVIAPTRNGSFRSFAIADARVVVRKPASLSFAEAPVLIGYLTAHYGLIHCARLRSGERVLIHNATGGVGLAAIQCARRVGAEIHATAGTPEKREYLRSIGIGHVHDSRSLAFFDEVLRDTAGYGVDVVLNALPEPALSKSLDLLAPFGRFIEIGKKDISENNGLPLHAFNRNLSFSSIDLDRMLAERPAMFKRLCDEIIDLFDRGELTAQPTRVFDAARTADAFRFMATGNHIGKVVVTFDGELPALPAAGNSGEARVAGSWLVTGGTGGFGLRVACWLARNGAERLVLVSRGGVREPGARHEIEALIASGVKVDVERLDVTDAAGVRALVERIGAEGPPLRGVVHSAMVLDDGFLADLTEDRWTRVIEPKVAGALILHQATLDQALDHFVLFSSVSSMLGNRGQGNYVVANGFLDHFAAFRRASGLPCISVNWGALDGAGVVERNAELREYFAYQGMGLVEVEDALDQLGRVLHERPAQVGIFSVDWEKWARAFPDAARTHRFGDLVTQPDRPSGPRDALVAELLDLDPAERERHVAGTIRKIISHTLKLPVDRISADEPLANLGVDSLMTVELVVGIERETGVPLTTMDILKGATVALLTMKILESLLGDEAAVLDSLDDLSEDELDALIQSTGAAI